MLPSSDVPNTLTAEEVKQGWKLLFDGKRLIGMRGLQRTDPLSSGWKVQDGELLLAKSMQQMDRVTGGDLITADQFWDFDFRFECKISAAAESGVRYMLLEGVGQSGSGLKYQICDGVHSSLKVKGNKTMHTGALYNMLPVGANARLRYADPLNKIGDPWNEGRIFVQGNHVEHWLNGQKVLEFELGPNLRQLAAANRVQVPLGFGMKNRTRISILDQGYEVSFRNLKVLALPPQAVVLPPARPR